MNAVKCGWGFKSGLLLALLASVSLAQAAAIFQDNFDTTRTDGSLVTSTTNTLGNGWTETSKGASDVSIVNFGTPQSFQGAMRLRDINQNAVGTDTNPDAAASQSSLSTTGFNTINLSFDWGLIDLVANADDHFFVSWRASNAGTWTQLFDFALDGLNTNFLSQSASLGIAADNSAILQLLFWTNVSAAREGVYVDNILLTGERIVVSSLVRSFVSSQVPEPGTMALVGLGLIGLGFMRRRKA